MPLARKGDNARFLASAELPEASVNCAIELFSGVDEVASMTRHGSTLLPNPNHKAWDSSQVLDSKAFREFRERLCEAAMPWTLTPRRDRPFKARIETLSGLAKGLLLLAGSSPHAATRAASQVARMREEYFHAVLPFVGHIHIDQAGKCSVAGPGSILVFDNARPTRVTFNSEAIWAINVLVPKSQFAGYRGIDDSFNNVILRHGDASLALRCMQLMAAKFDAASQEEMEALLDATIAFLPIAAGCFGSRGDDEGPANARYLFREVLHYVNRNLGDHSLSALHVAANLGITDRYVHKLFAQTGSTFSAYVKTQRLNRACQDLVAAHPEPPIALIAWRWGFRDFSTFSRSFKARFGCTPREWRRQHRGG